MLISERSWPNGNSAPPKNSPMLNPIEAISPPTISSRQPTRCGRCKPHEQGEADPDENAERFADDDRNRQSQRAGLKGAYWHAGIDEPEEEQRGLGGIPPPHLELTQRVLRGGECVDEESGIACRVRQERHDRHQRQRRMQAAPEEPEPRNAAGDEQIGPEAADAHPPESVGDGDRSSQDRQPGEVTVSGGVEHREDHEPEHVRGDPEQQQERNRRVRTEDDPRDEIADGEIGRQGYGPAESASIGSSSASTTRM